MACMLAPFSTEPRPAPQVGQWTSLIVEATLGKLTDLQKPFKYVGERPSPV